MACPHVAGIVAGMKTRMAFTDTSNYLFVRSQVPIPLPDWRPFPLGFACYRFGRVVYGLGMWLIVVVEFGALGYAGGLS